MDIDWEYPGFAEHNGTAQDELNFSLLLEEVQSQLAAAQSRAATSGSNEKASFGLTAALPCGPSHIANIHVQRVARTLTELNLMTYDFHGAWDPTTGMLPLFCL
jgi:chitinase